MASANYANIKHSVRLSLGCKSSEIVAPRPSQLTLKLVSQTGDKSRPKHFAEAKVPKRTLFERVIYLQDPKASTLVIWVRVRHPPNFLRRTSARDCRHLARE